MGKNEMTQDEIAIYLIEVEQFKRDFFNNSHLASILKEYTGIDDTSFEGKIGWTEIVQALFNFIEDNNAERHEK